jgi:hypothetical protein
MANTKFNGKERNREEEKKMKGSQQQIIKSKHYICDPT